MRQSIATAFNSGVQTNTDVSENRILKQPPHTCWVLRSSPRNVLPSVDTIFVGGDRYANKSDALSCSSAENGRGFSRSRHQRYRRVRSPLFLKFYSVCWCSVLLSIERRQCRRAFAAVRGIHVRVRVCHFQAVCFLHT